MARSAQGTSTQPRGGPLSREASQGEQTIVQEKSRNARDEGHTLLNYHRTLVHGAAPGGAHELCHRQEVIWEQTHRNRPFSDIVYLRKETAGERTLLSAAAVEHALKVL